MRKVNKKTRTYFHSKKVSILKLSIWNGQLSLTGIKKRALKRAR